MESMQVPVPVMSLRAIRLIVLHATTRGHELLESVVHDLQTETEFTCIAYKKEEFHLAQSKFGPVTLKHF
jgi:hypothetical protein